MECSICGHGEKYRVKTNQTQPFENAQSKEKERMTGLEAEKWAHNEKPSFGVHVNGDTHGTVTGHEHLRNAEESERAVSPSQLAEPKKIICTDHQKWHKNPTLLITRSSCFAEKSICRGKDRFDK